MRTLNPLLARRGQVDPSPQALIIMTTFVVGLAIGVAIGLTYATLEWWQHGCGC
jgi:hypothetical protein